MGGDNRTLRLKFAWWMSLPMLVATPAFAQDSTLGTEQAPVTFSADSVSYDTDAEIITASGAVRMANDGNSLAADEVVWNRKTGEVTAIGNVVLVTPGSDKLVSDRVTLTDTLRDGTVENLMVVLDNGGRLAAARATRVNDVTTLEQAIYTPCPVETESGCPKRPSWAITAAKVIDDPALGRIRFEGGRLQLFGVELPLLPFFALARGSDGASGWLVPDFSYSTRKGLEIAQPYHWQLAPNRDATLTPHLFTGVFPALAGQYRELNSVGAYAIGGFVTYGKIEDANNDTTDDSRTGVRVFVEANGKWQFNPAWSTTTAIRAASDKTVTRRYDLTSDDRLRSFINTQRITPDNYISIAGWAFQGLRVDDEQKQIPIVLPAIDAHFLKRGVAGGVLDVQANSLSILRIDGQDTQRAFASVRWDLRKITPLGQVITFTALGRGDLYHTKDAQKTTVPIYRGTNGWHARGIAALAADMQWPFAGPLGGGLQRITPRVQLVLTPATENSSIPNEDSRSVDLEESNLFALNRFPGYDRWEDQSRLTYGADWRYEQTNLVINAQVGQSYRLVKGVSIFPDGTGLTGRASDFVGRTRIRYGRFIDLSHRFRLDKNNFAVRRNEVDLTVGTDQTYAQIGYLRFNRDVDPTIEDLRDKEELRLAGRILFARHWSIFGSTVLDLTDTKEDPLSLADGWEQVRDRLGVLYADDCLELGLTWRRDYERIGTFRKGSTLSLHLALKGLSR